LLARAQSLSGRPHDALVMLGRLAEMGYVINDAITNDEFRTVRELRDWPALEARILGKSAPSGSTRPASGAAVGAPAPSAHDSLTAAPRLAEEALRLPSLTWNPTGVAYDRVSARFVLADRRGRKLLSVDERSHHLVELVGAESAGF